VVSAADPLRSLIQFSRPEPLLFLSSSSSFTLTRAEWTPFQIHCYSENLAAPAIGNCPILYSVDFHIFSEVKSIEYVKIYTLQTIVDLFTAGESFSYLVYVDCTIFFCRWKIPNTLKEI
jgi:hypothetical protein